MVKAFSYVIKVYFGINPDVLPQEKNENGEDRNIIISLACKTLLEKYPAMTFEKLNLSYSEEQTDKKQGISLTIDELMHPVALFWRKCEFIRIESEKIKRELDEEAEIEARKQAHKDESIRLYIECVNSDRVWKGTPFHANVFAKESFAHRFDQSEKDFLYGEAKRMVRELEARRNLALIDSIAFNEPIPDPVQMFSHLIVTEACKRGFEIIVG